MSKKANPALIGGFVLGAIALALVGVIVFGGSRAFEETFTCVAYFPESISGMDVGAPVDLLGVRIGTVTSVKAVIDGLDVYRPVEFQIENSRMEYVNDDDDVEKKEVGGYLEEAVQRGLRARIASQSMLTGKLQIELGFWSNTPIRRIDRDIGIWQMPTIPSPLAAISEKFEDLPIQEIVYETHRAMKGLAELINSEDTKDLIATLNGTLSNIETLIAKINKDIDPAIEKASKTMGTANNALDELRTLISTLNGQMEPFLVSLTDTSEKVSKMMDEQSPLRYQSEQAIRETTRAAKALAQLAEYLERHPESLLRGKPQ